MECCAPSATARVVAKCLAIRFLKSVPLQDLKQLGSTRASGMTVLLESYKKVVSDAQKVQSSKGKDKKLLCSDLASGIAQAQAAKVDALAGV